MHYFSTSEQLQCLVISPATARKPVGAPPPSCWKRSPVPVVSIRKMSEEAREEEWRTATILAGTLNRR